MSSDTSVANPQTARLCAHTLGYVAPPSVAMFIDDSRQSGPVRDALDAFVRTKQLKPPPGLREPRDCIEYVRRATVLVHERRHSHDLLGTTIGNHLVFSSVALALRMLARLQERARAGDTEIIIPFADTVDVLPDCPDYRLLGARSQTLMEGSALLCQMALTARDLGSTANVALMMSFLKREGVQCPYDQFLRAVAALVSRFGPQSRALPDVALLLLSGLCEAPSREFKSEQFIILLEALAAIPLDEAERDLHDRAQRGWERGRASLLEVEQSLKPWRTQIDEELKAHGREVVELVHAGLDDFATHAREMRARIVDEPDVFANPYRYLAEDLVCPLVCAMRVDSMPAATDPVAGVRYMDRETSERFTFEFAPAINLAMPPGDPIGRALFVRWLAWYGITKYTDGTSRVQRP